MVRYTANEFLNEYTKFLTKSNTIKKGTVELTFKRYDATDENNLPPTADKTGETRTKSKPIKKLTKTQKKGAANPESNKKNSKLPDAKSTKKAEKNEAVINDPAVLVRARFGDKKVSCVVKSVDIVDFNEQFRTIFRLYNKSLVPAGQLSECMKKRKAAQEKK